MDKDKRQSERAAVKKKKSVVLGACDSECKALATKTETKQPKD